MKTKDVISELNWSTWITGGNIFGRKCICMLYFSISDILLYLSQFDKYSKGVVLLRNEDNPKLLSRLGQKTRSVDLRELINGARVYSGNEIANSDFYFVPYVGSDYPCTAARDKLLSWALEKGLPYVYQHDNDHVCFSGFPSAFEKKIFCLFLSKANFLLSSNFLKLNNADWQKIRRGIYSHGWTLNRLLCKFDVNLLEFNAWAGVPSSTILAIFDFKTPSEYNEKICIKINNGKVLVHVLHAKCPLSDDYGKLIL